MALSTDKPNIPQDPAAPVTDSAKVLIDTVGQSASIPHFYFNGFVTAQGTGDVTFILQLNNKPVAALNCSFTLAKTLSQKLGESIRTLEQISDREILTTDDIARLFTQKKDADDKTSH